MTAKLTTKSRHLFNEPLFPDLRLYDWPQIRYVTNMGNPKTTQERLVDSFIVAAITFFSTLAALGYPPELAHLYVAGVSFCATFFTQWAYERGVKSRSANRPSE